MSDTLVMPNLGAASDEATLVSWLVQAGDRVTVGQPIYEIETDKSVVTVEATDDGQIGRLLVEPGETVAIGAPIAEFRSDRESAGPQEVRAEPAAVETSGFELPSPSTAGTPDLALERRSRSHVSPRARRSADRLGIDPATFMGTGPDGLVTEADVNAAAGATSVREVHDESGRDELVEHPETAD